MSILPDEHNLFYFSVQETNLCRKKDGDPPWSRTLPEALCWRWNPGLGAVQQ